MMHFHCEIVMPPTDDVDTAVFQIMCPFSEDCDDPDGAPPYAFWDWYVVGGRWAGAKMEAAIGLDRIQAFRDELVALKVTVSAVRAGKPSLCPESQISLVDDLWSERFPDHAGVCPLFAHANANNATLPGDVAPLSSVPLSLSASRIIIAAPAFDGNGLQADFMATDELWNGCNYERTTWDKTLGGALLLHSERLSRWKAEAQAERATRPDWLVVTVDYHS